VPRLIAIDFARRFEPDAAHAGRLAMAAKFGLLKLVQRAIVEHHDLDRHAELHEAQEIAHQHGEAAVARQGDHLAAGNAVSRAKLRYYVSSAALSAPESCARSLGPPEQPHWVLDIMFGTADHP
jgi:hypothetical protein